MLATVTRVPADGGDVDPQIAKQLAMLPGLVHLYLMAPEAPGEERLAVMFWETRAHLDRYLASDVEQQASKHYPSAKRVIYNAVKLR